MITFDFLKLFLSSPDPCLLPFSLRAHLSLLVPPHSLKACPLSQLSLPSPILLLPLPLHSLLLILLVLMLRLLLMEHLKLVMMRYLLLIHLQSYLGLIGLELLRVL
jgi:hypothetical protein